MVLWNIMLAAAHAVRTPKSDYYDGLALLFALIALVILLIRYRNP